MAYAHLINCLLLSFGPFFVIYRAKNLSDYRAFFVCAFAALGFLLTSACKMIILASLLSSSGGEETSGNEISETDLLMELRQNLFNLIDVLGIYFILGYKWTFMDNLPSRILSISLGWSFAESICRSLFYFILNAAGDEFSFSFIMRAIFNNLELFENIAIVALIIFINKEFRGISSEKKSRITSRILLIFAIIFLKTVILPTVLSYFKNNYLEDLDKTVLFAKAGFTSFLILFANNQKVF